MSKSGSKALSKSVDSVVKSVESVVTSVLPKNMNMKHVLLAILVGLLLCMLFSNTVEGLIAVQDNETPACPAGFIATQLAANYGTTGGPAGQKPDANMGNVNKWGCYSGSGSEGDESNWGPVSTASTVPLNGCGTPPSGTDAPTGLCRPTTMASTADVNACYTQGTSSDTCGSELTENCEWIDKTTYKNNGLLTGDALNMLLHNLNIKKYQCPGDDSNLNFDGGGTDANLAEIMNTKLLPIMGIIKGNSVETSDPTLPEDQQTGKATSLTDNDDWKKISNPDNIDATRDQATFEYKDLLYFLFKDSPNNLWNSLKTEKDPTKWVGAINQSDKIPDDLKGGLSLVVKNCTEAWRNPTLEKIYPHNGGRPIIGLDQHAGAVCRNTPYKPKVDVINEWRLHVGEGCPNSVGSDGKLTSDGGTLTCGSGSECNAIKGVEAAVMSQNPFAVNNRCSLKKCRDSATLCPTQNLTDFTGSMIDNSVKQLKDTFGIPFA